MINRREILSGLASVAFGSGACANSELRPAVGAIRWDAWYIPSAKDSIRSAVEKTLGPARWHGRAPSCAVVTGSNQISLEKCGVQLRIDREISKAHEAGIDYWAYGWYGADHPMQQAWRLHQSSQLGKLVNWSYLIDYRRFVGFISDNLQVLIGNMKLGNYQTVLDGRHLIYLLNTDMDQSTLAKSISLFRNGCADAGLRNPYIVLMLSSPLRRILDATGADAVSAYEKAGPIPVAGTYAELVTIAETYWETLTKTEQAVVPTAMTGWDTRPRQETPSFATNPRGPNGEEHYYAPGTPQQIAAHIRDMRDWITRHPQSCPAQTGIIYSWDEHDEGGSTLNATLESQDSILDSVGRALK